MRKTHLLAITIIVFVLFASLLAYYFIFTNSGSTLIVKSALSEYTRSKSVNIKKSEGSLARTLVFHGIEIKDSKTALINLRESKISLFGDPKKASLDLKLDFVLLSGTVKGLYAAIKILL